MKNSSIVKWSACIALIGAIVGTVANGQTPTGRPVDVMLVLDNSGSMKQNDPKGLLKEAVSEFARQLPTDTHLGVVIFDQRVDLALNPTKVSDPEFQSNLSQCLKRVDYSGKWTDIPGGIERALYTLTHDGRPDSLQAIVFFTDGIIETGDKARDRDRTKWLREDLAAEAKQRGIRIFGVAFTETADYELIQSVAQATGGEHYRVLNSSDIAGAFARISKEVLQPLPMATQPAGQVETGAPLRESSWTIRLVVIALIGLVMLGIVIVFLVRRRATPSPTVPESENVPRADIAHLIDVGGHSGAARIPLIKRRVRIGREAKLNDVCIPDTTISSQHATIDYRDGCFYLRDLRSSNGTFINGKRMSDPDVVREAMLKTGDRIRFDAFEFIFNLDAVSVEATPGPGSAPERQKTTLRQKPNQQVQAPPPPQPAMAARPAAAGPSGAPGPMAPAPTIRKMERVANAPAETRIRSEFCPHHPAWKATELCSKCGIAKCKACMTEQGGKAICTNCAVSPSA
jgi:pSer/pThr/pTyr-binding forkhead associated (FHA) protein